MPRRRSSKAARPLREANQQSSQANVLQLNEDVNSSKKSSQDLSDQLSEAINIKSLVDDENCDPNNSSIVDNLNTHTAALYSELDSFRQRWKRELEETKQVLESTNDNFKASTSNETGEKLTQDPVQLNNKTSDDQTTIDNESKKDTLSNDTTESTYDEAKRLFLLAVELEQDEMHHESIRYYKQAMHLYPDIEKQIFKEQCEASAKENALVANAKKGNLSQESGDNNSPSDDDEVKLDLYDRISQNFQQDELNENYIHCRPNYKPKQGSLHFSDLPHEIVLMVYRYVVGEDLDLASLESVGSVCRGFYLLSRDQSLWRSICFSAWGKDTLTLSQTCDDLKYCKSNTQMHENEEIDWYQMYLNRPRINYDGVYISRTRYIRQGDVGFQDITYRPFHVIRYYRYLRFFPDKRVLILTTNEEPDKIIPIFRHALHARQFSSELSVLEGTFDLTNQKQITIVAEKDCRNCIPVAQLNHRRQAQFHWSRQTPLTQKFNLRFELKTVESKPYRNNVLKWIDYSILTRLETGQEVASFDITPETFPSLLFSRVKRFNLKLTKPLTSH